MEKIKNNNKIKRKKKENEASKGMCTPRDGSKNMFFSKGNVTRNRAAIEVKKMKNPKKSKENKKKQTTSP